jgi:hypothetical protein
MTFTYVSLLFSHSRFCEARDWLAHKLSKGDIPDFLQGERPSVDGHIVPFGIQLCTHVSGKIIGLLQKEFPTRKRICFRPNFKIGVMDGELLGIGNM